MEIKTAQKQSVVKVTVKAKLKSLLQDAGKLPETIMEEIGKAGLNIAGPQMWTYIGADGQADTEFDLEIAVPVSGTGKLPAPFELGQTVEFPYVSHTHNGAWDEFPQVYEKFMTDICAEGKQLNGICREVYLHCDFDTPANCVTEIQVGVKQ